MKHEFTAILNTPLFMGGANARVSPEIRGQSMRGMMRYWYRALIAGSDLKLVQEGNRDRINLASLVSGEEEVFGSTNLGSKFSIEVRGEWQNQIAKFQKDRALRTPKGDYLPTGKDYLLWSMAESGKFGTTRYLPAREYIKPGTKFNILLRSKLDGLALEKAAASLWLAANLGSFGSRANRGAGSFQITSSSGEGLDIKFELSKSIEQLEKYLREGISTCRKLIANIDEKSWVKFEENSAPFDIITPSSAEIWVVAGELEGWETYLDALNAIGGTLRNFRSHTRANSAGKIDHDAVLNWLAEGGSPPKIQRAVFGLPIPFRYSEGGPSDVIQSNIGDRRSSPLRIRITKLSTGRFVGVMTLFKSKFLADQAELQLQTRKWKAPPPQDYRLIEQFIQAFPQKVKVSL